MVGLVETGTIDLFFVLVETVFGSVAFAGLAILVVMWLVGMLSKMSLITLMFISMLFVVGYFGTMVNPIFALPIIIISIIYFSSGILNLINARTYG